MKNEYIYLALVDTPGFFASIIRRTIRIPYVHVVLSLDCNLEQAYSFGRRHPSIPLIAGFERERLEAIARAFPTARYKVATLSCTPAQKTAIARQLEDFYRKRFRYHYCILGLPFLLARRPFYQKRHFTCSSFAAWLLAENGLNLFDKHFSLVTPRDFYELPGTVTTYEGQLATFPPLRYHRSVSNNWKRWETVYEP